MMNVEVSSWCLLHDERMEGQDEAVGIDPYATAGQAVVH
jgi:hypothetical protein